MAQYAFLASKVQLHAAVEEQWKEFDWQFRRCRREFDEEDKMTSPDEFFGIFATFIAQFEVRSDSSFACVLGRLFSSR